MTARDATREDKSKRIDEAEIFRVALSISRGPVRLMAVVG
jgi:hypothetical protein